MNDVAQFYKFVRSMEDNEQKAKDAKDALRFTYAKLVEICPHSEAVEHRFNSGGTYRICKICGIEDHESVGGTPGDEYNYGTHGRPDPKFWGDADVENIKDEKYFWTFRKQHGWKVVNGKPSQG
jgi:hypothetical protein